MKDAVRVAPQQTELTTQEAADLLHVSQPYLIGLLDTGTLPCHTVGAHRRMLREDILAYKTKIDEARLATLQELTAQAQELDMGYQLSPSQIVSCGRIAGR